MFCHWGLSIDYLAPLISPIPILASTINLLVWAGFITLRVAYG
jgi:hypothetical protein